MNEEIYCFNKILRDERLASKVVSPDTLIWIEAKIKNSSDKKHEDEFRIFYKK